jgi:hypothetical protein
MSGERFAAAEQIAPGQTTGSFAHPRCGRLTGCEFGEINRARSRCGKAQKKASGYHYLHAERSSAMDGELLA